MINLKRAYESSSRDDGARYLVERLRPRGVAKADLPLDGWLKDIAPSTALRKCFTMILRGGQSSARVILPSSKDIRMRWRHCVRRRDAGR
jgi:hypothetical protein